MEVISSFISMVLDISSSKMQGSKPDMPINKEHAVFLDLHNKTRDIYNLGPLEEDRGCLLVAQSHATWMARSSTLGHLGFSFFGPPQRLAVIGKEPYRIGECISFSRSTSSSEVMKQWFNSNTHKSIILGNYSKFGVGTDTCDQGYVYWCAIYTDDTITDSSPILQLSDGLIEPK